MPTFTYRFVPYGTHFETQTGLRPPKADKNHLYENELVADVGGHCYGLNYTGMVFDHHFPDRRAAPCAAAAVFLNAEAIRQHFVTHQEVVLVSHVEPDYDALGSLYLARRIIEGTLDTTAISTHPIRQAYHDCLTNFSDLSSEEAVAKWTTLRGYWFKPFGQLPDGRHAANDHVAVAYLLAQYAAFTDNGRRMACPRVSSLHAILYATNTRNRPFANVGKTAFFDTVATQIMAGRHPLTDNVFAGNPDYTAELELLERQQANYVRDLARARKTTVYLAQANAAAGDFGDWFKQIEPDATPTPTTLTPVPLVNDRKELAPAHARLATDAHERVAVDGIFLRDPECLFFKDWVRDEYEMSAQGKGYLFTAIAYSNAFPSNRSNTSRYFFSLDPERAGRLHLYSLWAAIQAAEVQRQPVPSEAKKCREGFEWRGRNWPTQFNNPWYDGSAYQCTIIDTPHGGTIIGSHGTKADLTDDAVVALVTRELELANCFPHPLGGPEPTIALDDVLPNPEQTKEHTAKTVHHPLNTTALPLAKNHYRFCQTQLLPNANVHQLGIADRVARVLWAHLEPQAAYPSDSAEHLFVGENLIGVWSARGIAVATTNSDDVKDLRTNFLQLMTLAGSVQALLADMKQTNATVVSTQHHQAAHEDELEAKQEVRRQAYRLSEELAGLVHFMSLPSNQLLQRFFRASGLGEVLRSVTETESALSRDGSLQTIAEVQTQIELVEIFVIAVYAVELTHAIAHGFHFNKWVNGIGVLAFGLIAFFFALWRKRPHNMGRILVYAVIALVLMAAYIVVGIMTPEEKKGTAEHATTPPAKHQE